MNEKSYSIDVFAQGFARLFGGLLSFVSIFAFTYIFDESEIGEYNLLLSSINILCSLSTLWISQSILRFYKTDKDFGFVITLSIVSCIICYIVLFTFSIFNPLLYLYITILIFYNILDSVFRSSRSLVNYVIMELLLALSRLFPMIFLNRFMRSYYSIFLSQSIVLLIFFLFLIIVYKDKILSIRYQFNLFLFKKYFKFGIPLMGLALSNWFLTYSDRFIIKFYYGNVQVGIYSNNYSLANSVYMMFALILINAYHPVIVKKWEDDKDKVSELISYIVNLYLMFMLPITFYGCLKSDIILSLFKGSEYVSEVGIFNWTATGILLYGLSLLFHKYFELNEKTEIIFILNLIVSILNIILNFWLIPIMGFSVAAFTTFLSYLIYIFFVRIMTYKKFPITFDIKKIALITLSILLFYIFDRLVITDRSIIIFLAEGIFYILYIIVVYSIANIFNFKKLIFEFKNGK